MPSAQAIALAAAALSLLTLVFALVLWRMCRKVREAQLALLAGGKTDIVDFAVSLQGRIDDLHRAVDEIAQALTRVDKRIDGTLANVSVMRYDAYHDKGGQQSATIALLNAARSGFVITAIQGRDYARIYMKELDRGNCAIALSPEEEEAVRRAMAR